MIIKMTRVRILGRREKHIDVVRALQNLNLVHLSTASPGERLAPVRLTAVQGREARHLRAALRDIESVLSEPRPHPPRTAPPAARPGAREFARWARRSRRARRSLDRLKERTASLQEERALVLKYRDYFSAFETLLKSQATWRNATAYHVVLRPLAEDSVQRLRHALAEILADEFEMRAQSLPSGETVLLILVPASAAGRIERVLGEARVQEIPVPAAYGGRSLAEAIPKMLERLEAIPRELEEAERHRAGVLHEHGEELRIARAAIHDRLAEIEALPLSSVTAHAFVLEGWLPAEALPRLRSVVSERCGEAVAVEEVAAEEWAAEEAPVVLSNPRLFRPFEVLIRLLPMPRYGSIDPTPFVAVFFPMFFGMILGDVAYGAVLAVLGLVLHAHSRPGSLGRAVSEISGACSAFTIIFGFLYGEFLGDLGRRLFGMRPILFDREEAVLPFLGLAVAIGLVHVLLGLGLGVANAVRRRPRRALGRGVAAMMVVLIVLALLAAGDVLPRAFFTPSVIALLLALPVLVIAEGLIAPLELLATLGNVLSYARVMALGTASVMLAVVANRMIGGFGGAVVGVLLALSFHLVNFALGLFSPTIHALRLHYVEFFGKFYSPGGTRYRPFGHWSPSSSRNT